MKQMAVIVNPIAGGGRGQQIWAMLQPGLATLCDHLSYRLSDQGEDIGLLIQELMQTSPECFVIIGGDGTLSHAINAIFCNYPSKMPPLSMQIAFYNAGCGGDFARQFPHQTMISFIDNIVHNRSITCDVGKITFGSGDTRYFMNIASCGFSALVAATSSRHQWLKKCSGKLHYFLHSIKTFLRYQPMSVSVTWGDQEQPLLGHILLIACCNGRFFGSNMQVAPMAKLHDGLLDMIIFHHLSRLKALIKLRKIYSGQHLFEKNVQYVQAARICIAPVEEEVLIEADGEVVGRLPASFEILPQVLQLIV